LALGASAANRQPQIAICDLRLATSNKGHETIVGAIYRWEWVSDRTSLLAVLGLTAIFACAIPLLLTHFRSLPAPAFWLVALIAGCLGGAVYPLAIRLWQAGGEARQGDGKDARRSAAAGTLYGADLLGGCLGALLGAAFLVPVLGIPQTCALVALAALAGLIAMV
jgi:predicted membrane-bound spermidine synthase